MLPSEGSRRRRYPGRGDGETPPSRGKTRGSSSAGCRHLARAIQTSRAVPRGRGRPDERRPSRPPLGGVARGGGSWRPRSSTRNRPCRAGCSPKKEIGGGAPLPRSPAVGAHRLASTHDNGAAPPGTPSPCPGPIFTAARRKRRGGRAQDHAMLPVVMMPWIPRAHTAR